MSFAKERLKTAKDAIGKKDFATAKEASLQAIDHDPHNYNAYDHNAHSTNPDVHKCLARHVFLGLIFSELDDRVQAEQARFNLDNHGKYEFDAVQQAYRKAISLNKEQPLAWQVRQTWRMFLSAQ
jgi:superkiller protein 3